MTFEKPTGDGYTIGTGRAPQQTFIEALEKFDPSQPRDNDGKWTDTGAGTDGREASALYDAATKDGVKTADQIISEAGATEAVNAVREKLKSEVPTNAPVSEGGFMQADGSYTPERAELQRQIVNRILSPDAIARALPENGQKPVLNFLGGRGGSGKSFITSANGPVDRNRTLLVDADAIKAMLPEYKGWNANSVHEESSHITNMIDDRAIAMGLNVTHDATLKSEANVVSRMQRYRAAGYDIDGYYVFASPTVAATRAIGRFMRGGATGRFVPPEVILGNTANEKNFDKMKKNFRHWEVYDNNGSSPRLVAKGNRK